MRIYSVALSIADAASKKPKWRRERTAPAGAAGPAGSGVGGGGGGDCEGGVAGCDRSPLFGRCCKFSGHICMQMYVCIDVCIFTHTHTHTHTRVCEYARTRMHPYPTVPRSPLTLALPLSLHRLERICFGRDVHCLCWAVTWTRYVRGSR